MTREVRVRSPPPEPRITLKVGGQPVTFLVDTGAQHSVLTQNPGPLSDKSAWVQGATGEKRYRWTTDRKVHLATDGNSYLHEEQRRAGAAVTTETEVIWARALPAGTSAQRAELITLTQALKMAEGKKLNVYTDSRYAFATAHVHGEIYKRRGLLTSEGKEIKNKSEILALLKALFLPKRLSIIHCPGHQRGNSAEARGNRMADQAAREAALRTDIETSTLLLETSAPYTSSFFHYTETDKRDLDTLGAAYDETKRYWVFQGKPVMPSQNTFELLDFLHQLTHLNYQKMRALLDKKKKKKKKKKKPLLHAKQR